MRSGSSVPTDVRRFASAFALTAVLAVPAAHSHALQAPSDSAAQAPRAVNELAAAQVEFQTRLDAYLELRQELSEKVRPLSTTSDAADLTARQEALAAAMKSARASARQGDLVPKPVAEQIAQIVRADRKHRGPSVEAAVLEEVPDLPAPAINRTYPIQAALPTVPPLLLSKLPTLPDNLQYRFYGRHVVILDGDLQIITDYITNVLPAH